MILEITIVLLAITIILLLAYILLQKNADKKNNVVTDQNVSLNDLKESIEVLKSTYGDKSNELNKSVSQMYTLLTGSSKAQGRFGEISLKMILEHAGFVKNVGYKEQQQIGLEKPDMIINLPEDRRVVIDSKVSLTDYNSFLNAEAEIENQEETNKSVSRSMSESVDEQGPNWFLISIGLVLLILIIFIFR